MKFDSYHPFINVLYFVAALYLAFACNHPIFIGIGYVCSFIYSVKLNGMRAIRFNLILVPIMAAFTCVYAYNEHFGVTVLSQTIIDNQITLEAVVYGFSSAVRVGIALMWMSCVLNLFTADKVVYLLGRIAPRLSLFVAIALRGIPVIKTRYRQISVARSGLGRGPHQGTLWFRFVNWVKRVSILITWTIERFTETSESMRCRGSQLRGRTAYSLYRFDNRDRSFVLGLVAMLAILIAGIMLDQTTILYAPSIIFNKMTAASAVFYCAYAVFCLLPFGLQVIGERRFKACIEHAEFEEGTEYLNGSAHQVR